jgi:hypothetical protein
MERQMAGLRVVGRPSDLLPVLVGTTDLDG